MSVLPAEVHEALNTLLKGLQSADNVERTAAEERLNKEWVGERPDVLLMGLTEQIQLAQETSVSIAETLLGNAHVLILDHSQTRTFAAVLFRRQSAKPRKDPQGNARDLFLTLPQAEREAIRAKLLQCLSTETDSSVRSKIGDAVAELGRQHTDEGWSSIRCYFKVISHTMCRCCMARASGSIV
jgi:importin-5